MQRLLSGTVEVAAQRKVIHSIRVTQAQDWMIITYDCERVNQRPFGFWSSVVNLLQNMSVTRFQVPRCNEPCLKWIIESPFCQSWWHPSASRGWCACCMCERRKSPGRAHSVLTCVTCVSVVWLVDWMNIGWVSSCPAGIVTCCIWYNCWEKGGKMARFKVACVQFSVSFFY